MSEALGAMPPTLKPPDIEARNNPPDPTMAGSGQPVPVVFLRANSEAEQTSGGLVPHALGTEAATRHKPVEEIDDIVPVDMQNRAYSPKNVQLTNHEITQIALNQDIIRDGMDIKGMPNADVDAHMQARFNARHAGYKQAGRRNPRNIYNYTKNKPDDEIEDIIPAIDSKGHAYAANGERLTEHELSQINLNQDIIRDGLDVKGMPKSVVDAHMQAKFKERNVLYQKQGLENPRNIYNWEINQPKPGQKTGPDRSASNAPDILGSSVPAPDSRASADNKPSGDSSVPGGAIWSEASQDVGVPPDGRPNIDPPEDPLIDHRVDAAALKGRGIVTVDANDRGHRPRWKEKEGTNSGGEYLSYYEMSQIADNAELIINTPPGSPKPKPPSPEDPPKPPDEAPDEEPAPELPLAPEEPAPPAPEPEHEEPPATPAPTPNPKKPVPPRGPARPTSFSAATDGLSVRERIDKKIELREAKAAEAKAKLEEERVKAEKALAGIDQHMTKQQTKKIEVQVEVPKPWSWIQKSKYLSHSPVAWIIPRKWRGSYTMLEYHAGIASPNHGSRQTGARALGKGTVPGVRDSGDRRAPRFITEETIDGIDAPHTVKRDQDRGRKRLPDARLPSSAESKRRESLIIGRDKRTWAGALESQDRDAIAVGGHRALGVIGVDSRAIQRRTAVGRFLEGIGSGYLGIDRRRTPNSVGDAMPRVASSAEAQADINAKVDRTTRVARYENELAMGIPTVNPGPLPPRPSDRRKLSWQGWGEIARRQMDDRSLPENDRNRTVRPYRYRIFR